MEMIATTNRKLEQFLYCHGIRFHHTARTEDGMTAWYYVKEPFTMEIMEEWKRVLARIHGLKD